MPLTPTYDISRSYEENYQEGPFLKEIPPQRVITAQKTFLGFKVNSLLGIPAGPLLNAKWIKAYAACGFDLLVYKTVRTRETPCHPKPNCMFLDLSQQLEEGDFVSPLTVSERPPVHSEQITITNSFGIPSRDPRIWQKDIETANAGLKEGQVLIVSVVGTPGEDSLKKDYVKGAALAAEAGAPIIEINLSCPNVISSEGSIFTDPDVSSDISKVVKREIGDIPLIIKIGYMGDLEGMTRVVAANAPYVDAISSINTLSFEVINQQGDPALPGKGRLRSGVCGAAIRKCALLQARRLVDLREKEKYDFSVVGVGGVMTPDHIQSFLQSGVDAVMSATGAMWNPFLAYDYWKAGSH